MENSQCENCAWFYDDDDQPELTCEAFAPDGIPKDILNGKISHTTPWPGQRDPEVLYKPLLVDIT